MEPVEGLPPPTLPEVARHCGFLSALPAEMIDRIVEGSMRVSYPRRTVLVDPRPGGERLRRSSVILQGSLRVFLVGPSGEQETLGYRRSGDFIGVTRLAQPSGLEFLSDTEMLVLDSDRLDLLAASEVEVAGAIIQELRRGIDEMLRVLRTRVFGSMRARVAGALVDQAKAAGEWGPGSEVPGTQDELAVAVGSVREVVSAALHALRRDGLIDIRRGRVVILAPDDLASEAEAAFGASTGKPQETTSPETAAVPVRRDG